MRITLHFLLPIYLEIWLKIGNAIWWKPHCLSISSFAPGGPDSYFLWPLEIYVSRT